jgi:two-component system copper resistance phosphate regulon response regulator CusR
VRVLLVEDDIVIAEQIARTLERERYKVDVIRDGVEAEARGLDTGYNLIILDVMLPRRDGWTICSNLRRAKVTTPILMLTARDSIEDRIKGLEGGADDYLPKPFDTRELMARMKALQRRDQIHRTGVIEIADLEIDTGARSVTRSGQLIKLTRREYDLLEALARNEGRTLTREAILERVWNNEESQLNTVNFHVASLRKKVDADFEPKLIQTVHGIGYVLRRP